MRYRIENGRERAANEQPLHISTPPSVSANVVVAHVNAQLFSLFSMRENVTAIFNNTILYPQYKFGIWALYGVAPHSTYLHTVGYYRIRKYDAVCNRG